MEGISLILRIRNKSYLIFLLILLILSFRVFSIVYGFSGEDYWQKNGKMIGTESYTIQWTKAIPIRDESYTLANNYYTALYIDSKEGTSYSFKISVTSGSSLDFFLFDETNYNNYINGYLAIAIISRSSINTMDIIWIGDGTRVYVVYQNLSGSSITFERQITGLPTNISESNSIEIRLDDINGEEGTFKVTEDDLVKTRIVNMVSGKNSSGHQYYYFFNWENLPSDNKLEYEFSDLIFYLAFKADAKLNIKIDGSTKEVPVKQFSGNVTYNSQGFSIIGEIIISLSSYSGTLLKGIFIGKLRYEEVEYADYTEKIDITEVIDLEIIESEKNGLITFPSIFIVGFSFFTLFFLKRQRLKS